MINKGWVLLLLLVALCGCQKKTSPDKISFVGANHFADSLEIALKHLQEPIGEPKWGDWLYRYPEKGQTFEDYWQSQPTQTTSKRDKIYFQLYGNFDTSQVRLMNAVREYVTVFYQLPVEMLEQQKLDTALLKPTDWRRKQKYGGYQVKTSFLLQQLENRLPTDAVLVVGFTTADLYPSEKWNYVFGQARLKRRVGVWSIARFGDPSESTEHFALALGRTSKTAVHEIGHVFSIRHCTFYRCAMQGSYNLKELDGHPLYFCPVCEAKVISNLGVSLASRYGLLSFFWKNQNELELAKHYQESKNAVLPFFSEEEEMDSVKN